MHGCTCEETADGGDGLVKYLQCIKASHLLTAIMQRDTGLCQLSMDTGSIPDALSRDMEAAELSDSALLAFCVDITKSNSLLMSSCTAA